MADDEILIFAFEIGGDEIREIAWDEVRSPKNQLNKARRWLHFSRFSEEARTWLLESGTLPPLVCDVLFQEETRPRAFRYDDALVLNLRGVNLNEGASPQDLISLRIYADPNLIVTTRAHRAFAIEELKKLVENGTAPATNWSKMVFLSDRLTEQLEPVAQRLEEQVDALEADMLDQNTPPPKLAVADFRRAVLSLRRYIFPQREAIAGLMREGNDLLSDTDKLNLRETQDTIYRISEQLDMVRERALVLQEQIAELRAEAMNQRLFVLAIISAVFLPLGFVTGLFGVNVGGMPGVGSPLAFTLLCAGMLVLVGILLALFRRMKWL